jgi:predicted ATPase
VSDAAHDSKRPFLRRVSVRNCKSIGSCQLELANLAVLVGHNGAGKSNFLDALRFVVAVSRTKLPCLV